MARVFHAVGQPGNVLVREDAEIHQRLPHEDVAFLVGVAGHRPWIGDADRRRYAPAQDQGLIARHVGQRLGRNNLGWRGCILRKGSRGQQSGRDSECHGSN